MSKFSINLAYGSLLLLLLIATIIVFNNKQEQAPLLVSETEQAVVPVVEEESAPKEELFIPVEESQGQEKHTSKVVTSTVTKTPIVIVKEAKQDKIPVPIVVQPEPKKDVPAPQPSKIPQPPQEKQIVCTPNWECGVWSECSEEGNQIRTCIDIHRCGTDQQKPKESQTCTLTKNEPLPEVLVEAPHPIQIIGTDNCVTQTNEALSLLRNKSKTHYDIVITYIGVIECTDTQSGMHAWEKPPRFQVGNATRNAGTIWYAGTIVHDAWHSKQYNDYVLTQGTTAVPAEVYSGKNAEAECLDMQHDALSNIGATQSTLDYIQEVIKSEYWNVDYDKRWW